MKKNIWFQAPFEGLKIIVFLFTLFLFSCSSDNQSNHNDLFEDNLSGIVKKHRINQITEIGYGIDTADQILWKRVGLIRFFDKNGLLIKELKPDYVKATVPKIANATSMLNFLSKMSETNIPTGEVDTITYIYDKNGNLLTKKDTEHQYTETFKYDKHNNVVEHCFGYREITCKHFIYEYNSDGRIISKLDSLGPISSHGGRLKQPPPTKYYYKYDQEGKVISTGEFEKKYDASGLLVELKDRIWSDRYDKYSFKYDNQGRRVSIIYEWVTIKNNQITHSVIIHKTYFIYNSDGLCIQEKVLNNENELSYLTDFEYSYYP